jgi:hypothetical protein
VQQSFIYLFLEVSQSGYEETSQPVTLEGTFYLRLGSVWFDSRRGHRATKVVVLTSHLKYAKPLCPVVLAENDSTDKLTEEVSQKLCTFC